MSPVSAVRKAALPVTDVGKPYKLALRADTTRRAIAEALAPFDGVTVDAVIEDGTLATVPFHPKWTAALSRYTVPSA